MYFVRQVEYQWAVTVVPFLPIYFFKLVSSNQFSPTRIYHVIHDAKLVIIRKRITYIIYCSYVMKRKLSKSMLQLRPQLGFESDDHILQELK